MKLTAIAIKNAKPRQKPYKLAEIEMLAKELEIEPTTMVALCFLKINPKMTSKQLLDKMKTQLNDITS